MNIHMTHTVIYKFKEWISRCLSVIYRYVRRNFAPFDAFACGEQWEYVKQFWMLCVFFFMDANKKDGVCCSFAHTSNKRANYIFTGKNEFRSEKIQIFKQFRTLFHYLTVVSVKFSSLNVKNRGFIYTWTASSDVKKNIQNYTQKNNNKLH